jgi:allantoin racemase
MLDPGVQAARECLDIPVLGAHETSIHAAAMLAPTFSIVTVLDRLVPCMRRRTLQYGLSSALASVRSIDIPVLNLWDDRSRVMQAVVEEARRAVEEDDACAIVLGCTALSGLGQTMATELGRCGCQVPVVDPTLTAIKIAAMFSDLGISHSRRAYARPLDKTVVGFDLI